MPGPNLFQWSKGPATDYIEQTVTKIKQLFIEEINRLEKESAIYSLPIRALSTLVFLKVARRISSFYSACLFFSEKGQQRKRRFPITDRSPKLSCRSAHFSEWSLGK